MPRKITTVFELRAALASYPADMPVTIYSSMAEGGGTLIGPGVYLTVQDPADPETQFYYAADSPMSDVYGDKQVTVPLLTINA